MARRSSPSFGLPPQRRPVDADEGAGPRCSKRAVVVEELLDPPDLVRRPFLDELKAASYGGVLPPHSSNEPEIKDEKHEQTVASGKPERKCHSVLVGLFYACDF